MNYETGVLDCALRHAREHLNNLESLPAGPSRGLAEMRSQLGKPLADEGLPAGQVIEELAADSAGGIVNCVGGRFHAWVIGGALPAALAADWLTSAWDQNAGIYASGPAAAVAEEVAGAWLKELLHIPDEASFAFVTGCQMAHTTCLAAARHRVLANRGWNVEDRGLSGAPRIRLIAGSERHGSVLRAVRLLGLGRKNIVEVPVGPSGGVPAAGLAEELACEPEAPAIVLLQAGDVNTGAYDSFAELIPLAKQHGAWVHIDGAFGLWAAASPRFRHLMNGGHLADSWATDGHKWLNVPQDCGYAFVADREAHLGAMSHREPYLIHDGDARDQMDWNPEWSRR
ncbi:MAG: aspartate aminotransferase family protein, partial [Acidobacteriota bacterium]|nr:aspartate aminotransferase family protein [Acidobacteriota bacterium]